MGSGSGSYRRCFTGHRIRSRIVLTIGPAEDCLDSIMEAAQGNRARDLDTPPDWRLDAEEGNFELVDGWLGFGGGHKAYCRPGLSCRGGTLCDGNGGQREIAVQRAGPCAAPEYAPPVWRRGPFEPRTLCRRRSEVRLAAPKSGSVPQNPLES